MHGFAIVFDSEAPFRGTLKPGPPGQDALLCKFHAGDCSLKKDAYTHMKPLHLISAENTELQSFFLGKILIFE